MARGQQNTEHAAVFDEAEVVPLNSAATVPQSVGELLRKCREDFGIELRDAASYLCIRYPYLEAIEGGRLDELPGTTYAMGFVRAYADYLGLDSAAIVERYKDQTAELGGAPRLVFPSPLAEGKVPSGAIILIAVVSLILIYGGWVILGQQNIKIAELVPPVPESLNALLGSEETVKAVEDGVKPAEAGSEAAASETSGSNSAEGGSESATPAPVATPSEAENTPLESPQSEAAESTASVASQPDPVTETAETTAPDATTPSETTESAPQTTAAATPDPEPAALETASEPAREILTPEPAAPEAASEPARETLTPEPAAPEAVSEPARETPSPEAETPQNEATTPPPAETAAPAVAPAVSDVVERPTASEGEPSTAAAQEDTAETPAESPQTAALPPPPPAVASSEPRRYGVDNVGARIVITAKVDSWVEIRDAGGDLLLTRVLRRGDSYRVPDNPGILMLTGNAGGLEIVVDGDIAPKIGASGAVLHNVMLEPDALKAGTANRR